MKKILNFGCSLNEETEDEIFRLSEEGEGYLLVVPYRFSIDPLFIAISGGYHDRPDKIIAICHHDHESFPKKKQDSINEVAREAIRRVCRVGETATGMPVYVFDIVNLKPLLFGGKRILLHDGMNLLSYSLLSDKFSFSQPMPMDSVAHTIEGDDLVGWVPWSVFSK